MEWLKSTKWDGKLSLVTGGGAGGQGVTPFIEIPTSRSNIEEETQTLAGGVGGNTTTSSSSILPSSVLNRPNPTAPQQ